MQAPKPSPETIPASCNICGGADFLPGPAGRLANGMPPKCTHCGSLERHRALRAIYQSMPLQILRQSRALQFAYDISIDPQWFESLEISSYQQANHLDIEHIDRQDNRYDWVISNHVLEHVADDRRAIREMLRVTAPAGIVHINIPSPATRLETEDWGFPDPQNDLHYRHYGADFACRLNHLNQPFYCLQIVGRDDQTGCQEILYLMSKKFTHLRTVGEWLIGRGFVVLRAG